MYRNYRRTKNKKKIYLVVSGALIFLVLAAGMILGLTGKVDLIKRSRPDSTNVTDQEEAKTTSTAPTAQEDFVEGDDRTPMQNSPSEGSAVDTGGTIDPSVSQNTGKSSVDQRITVYTPLSNSRLKLGDTVQGLAQTNRVSFRLIDKISGIIAQGDLIVVNGRFSGKFDFSTTATEGRLDVFSVNPDGTESSNVEIPVGFN